MSEDNAKEQLQARMGQTDVQAAMLGFGLSAVLAGLVTELINKELISATAVQNIVQITREDFTRELGPIGTPLETALRMIEGAARKAGEQA